MSIYKPFRTLNQSFSVNYHYPVHFTINLLALENPLLARILAASHEDRAKVLFVIDQEVAKAHPWLLESIKAYFTFHKHLALVRQPLLVDGGEQCKNSYNLLDTIYGVVAKFGICRHSYIVAIGGGALLDAVGFAAATSHRGIRLVRIPTTVLSQADSAVGVKNGINAYGRKNFLGTFVPPAAVLLDFNFLTSLPDRDWRSGIAEILKVALLQDSSFFKYLETNATRLFNRDIQTMCHAIYHGARLHLSHIANSGDPFERGTSRPLDFGHWSAHKLEKLSAFKLRHGEVVALGIALDSTYSHLTGLLSGNNLKRIYDTIRGLGLALYHPLLSKKDSRSPLGLAVLSGIEEFREHLGGGLVITLIVSIGKGKEVHSINYKTMSKAINFLKEYAD